MCFEVLFDNTHRIIYNNICSNYLEYESFLYYYTLKYTYLY